MKYATILYMLSTIISSIAGIISFIILDYIWLSQIAKNFYLDNLREHVVLKDGSLVPYLPAVPLVYIVAVIGIWIFAIPKTTTALSAFLMGAMLGFVMYAFYDLTNLATLKNYPWSLTIVDTIWGTLLVGVVTLVIYLTHSFLS